MEGALTHTDDDLLQAIREQETDAFEILYERYRERVRLHVQGMLRDADAVEDVLQETFLRVWTRADQWDGRGACAAWLMKIATNLALNSLRTRRRKREVPLDGQALSEDDEMSVPDWMVDAAGLGPEASLELAERVATVRRLVNDLPEDKREVIRLVHEAEMGIREVAGRLDIPEGTVKSRLHNARKQLAQEWDKVCSEWEEL